MKRRYNPEKVSRALGLKIRQIRESKGWTLEYCEERGWPDWTHLQKVESGKNITVHTLVRIANLFGVTLSDLVEGI
jgi:transcriptional regulator with XRE-family HTH domain